MINILSEETIDQIAAGEVVERPASAVKELCENAIDAKATSISVEIREGGISLIRVSDNGCGIEKEDISKAFLRHATSKISDIKDLESVLSLGFRGEALSSIAAVSQVELITKTKESFMGYRYQIEGNSNGNLSEIGAPDGTTIVIRNLFYNTPVRRKFLKSTSTEGSYVTEVMEHLALSHPEIAFTYINGGKTIIQTSGKGDLKEVIYRIYGREVTAELLQIEEPGVSGYIAKPTIARSNRGFEFFFVNGRYVKSQVLSRALEEAYKPFLMQHKFPFAIISLSMSGRDVDANVHPTKLEVRFSDNDKVYNYVKDVVYDALKGRELIPKADVPEAKSLETIAPEKIASESNAPEEDSPDDFVPAKIKIERPPMPFEMERQVKESAKYETEIKSIPELNINTENAKQLDLFEEKILSKEARSEYKILGQAFNTYWIVEYKDELLMIDQHAAHEKVLYERFTSQIINEQVVSQQLMPPLVVCLNGRQISCLEKYSNKFNELGFEVEHFGGNDYAIYSMPENLSTLNSQDLFLEMLDDLCDLDLSKVDKLKSEQVNDRIATMACKAAVKGNNSLSIKEIEALLDELLELDNPYHCPHGRPTMITMSKYEMEKKFKRIV